jgi:menaquinone-specific isochorismate synthase
MAFAAREGTVTDSLATIREFVRERVRSLPEKSETVQVTIPAPLAHPAFLLRALPEEDGFLWISPDAPSLAGAGAALTVETTGDGRLADLRERAIELWKSLATIRHRDCPPRAPVLLGGLAFAAGEPRSEPWERFPDASFVLPRWCYGRDRDTAWLSLALRGEDDRARTDAFLDQLSEILDAAASRPPVRMPATAELSRREMGRPEWSALVESVRSGIRMGTFAKIVAARCTVVDLAGAADPFTVFDRLDRTYPDCHRFLLRRGGTSLLGASPERLVRKEGKLVRTEALAGSIETIETDDERRLQTVALLESHKDLAEHELVVEAIRRKLEPLCSELSVPARPQIRELRSVLHLHTPMSGLLAHDTHVLDLAAALHPTPSVGGVPTADATAWIAKNEPEPRGWYAGPIGWFDSDGNGDLAIAIRCGVLAGARAYVYAGAGIVADSDPEKEYEETRSKQRPFLRALGIDA